MKIRCSSIADIIGKPKTKGETITETAKSKLIEMAKRELFGFESFDGNAYTEKGNLLEENAIKYSGLVRGKDYQKNIERRVNDWLTGECDIYDSDDRLIIDTKCSWDIGTHPFFREEAEKKAIKAGYDWQMQGYMWLFDCDRADIDFWLLPTPEDLLKPWEEREKYIDLVESIPLEKRITTVTVMRDEEKIELIKERVTACQDYYETLLNQFRQGI